MCPYYKIYPHTMKVKPELGESPYHTTNFPWCAHPTHSPLNIEDLQRELGRRRVGLKRRLQCRGDLHRCPLKEESPEVHSQIRDDVAEAKI